MKTLVKTHMITILCTLALLALFLPFAKVSVEMEILGQSAGSSETVSGFVAVSEGVLGYLLIIGPVLLIAMNYIKQLGKYKGILSIIVPIICVLVSIFVYTQAKAVSLETMGYGTDDIFDLDISTSVGIGCILAILSYIGTAIAGAVTYHNFTFDKAGLEKLKNESTNFVQTAQEKVSQTVQSVSNSIESASTTASSNGTASPVRPQAKRATNLTRTEDTLALIEKLAKMRDAGVLTEEEFNEKKAQLLEEI